MYYILTTTNTDNIFPVEGNITCRERVQSNVKRLKPHFFCNVAAIYYKTTTLKIVWMSGT